MSGPLSSLKVLDFSTLLPGPFASLLLADMGLLTSGGVAGLAKRPKKTEESAGLPNAA